MDRACVSGVAWFAQFIIGKGASVNIGLALTYVTKDPEWVKKVLIGGLIFLGSLLFSIVLIGLLGFLVFFGYGIRTIRNVMNDVEHPLPDWDDIGGDLGRGAKAVVGVLVWLVPVWVLAICLAGLGATDNDALSLVASLIQFCLITPISILLSVFVLPVVIGRFAETNEIGPMLAFGDVIAEIRSVPISTFILYFVLTIITGLLAYVGLIACIIGVVFSITYAQYANFHGIGQIRRQIRESTLGPAAVEHPAF